MGACQLHSMQRDVIGCKEMLLIDGCNLISIVKFMVFFNNIELLGYI